MSIIISQFPPLPSSHFLYSPTTLALSLPANLTSLILSPLQHHYLSTLTHSSCTPAPPPPLTFTAIPTFNPDYMEALKRALFPSFALLIIKDSNRPRPALLFITEDVLDIRNITVYSSLRSYIQHPRCGNIRTYFLVTVVAKYSTELG